MTPQDGADDGVDTHPQPDRFDPAWEVEACPHCDSSNIKERSPDGYIRQAGGAAWHCTDCTADFEEPDRRPSKRLNELSQALANADPDDVVPDGGQPSDVDLDATVHARQPPIGSVCGGCGELLTEDTLEYDAAAGDWLHSPFGVDTHAAFQEGR